MWREKTRISLTLAPSLTGACRFLSLHLSLWPQDSAIDCTGAQPEKTGLNVLTCDLGNPLPSNKRVREAANFVASFFFLSPQYPCLAS